MATYNKFQVFVEHLCKGVHQLHSGAHVLKVYLTNNTPNAATHQVRADLPGITEQNGYSAANINNDITRTGGTAYLIGQDVTWTASGGSFGPFRYVVLFNDTPTSPADPLIAFWDYGSSITINDGESFKVDFGSYIFSLT